MGFTIKCNKCGTEQEFNEGDSKYGDSIEVDVIEHCDFQGCSFEGFTFYCENLKCNQDIDIK